ncbi:MAG: flagellar export chaperone FliS [Gemmatimonadales bacterium]|nr:MAG: flagellar export chaperone FliS [Gemmatimonadales bacterium]
MTYGRRSTDRGGPYRSNDVLTRTPGALVVMLYHRLLVELRRADHQISAGDFEGKAASLERASDIVFELLGSLNHEAGGELAGRLSALYTYFIREIQEVNRSLDRARLAHLVEVIGPLHASWSQAAAATVTGAVPTPDAETR